MPKDPPNPKTTAESMARRFFGAGSDPASIRLAVRRWLAAAVCALVLIPAIFWMRFGEFGPVGLGLTVFLVAYCLLSAVGLYYLRKPSFHSPVALKNDWLDRVGAVWLVCCALGPFLSWILVNALSLDALNWRWLYGGRFLLSAVLPILTALTLLRYVRGKGKFVMLAILIVITALPVWSAWSTTLDLWNGPVARAVQPGGQSQTVDALVLPYTGRVLAIPSPPGVE